MNKNSKKNEKAPSKGFSLKNLFGGNKKKTAKKTVRRVEKFQDKFLPAHMRRKGVSRTAAPVTPVKPARAKISKKAKAAQKKALKNQGTTKKS